MSSVTIIGTGNVAYHLAKAIKAVPGYELAVVAGRTPDNLVPFKGIARHICKLEDAPVSDITIIAVADDAIETVVSKAPYTSGVWAHTSGSKPMKILQHFTHYGVFYPLQTFSKAVPLDFKEIPIFIEAHTDDALEQLRGLAFALSKNVQNLNSQARKQLHLAAVFANNFTNHCLAIANDICNESAIDFKLLKPLLEQTIKNAFDQNPKLAQTGPAKRLDKTIIIKQLAQLKKPAQKEVYKALSNSIFKYYE